MSDLKEEFVKNYVEQRGYIFISLYKNNDFREVSFCDKCGYKYKTQWENFKSSKNFKQITYSNPFSVYNAKKYLLDNNMNVELLSNEINSVTEKLQFKCNNCGKMFLCSWQKIKERKYYFCDDCLKKSDVCHKEKLTQEEIFETFKKRNFFLLNISQYKGNNSYMDFEDSIGYKYRHKYSNIQANKNPRPFSKTNIYTIDNIKTYLKNNKANTEIISDIYESGRSLLKFKCGKCGKEFYRNWENFQQQTYPYCDNCSIVERGKNRRLPIEQVSKKFSELNLKLLDYEYNGNSKKLLCEDEFGYRGYVPYNHLERIKESSKNGFDYFSIKHNKDNLIPNIDNYCKLNNIGITVVKVLEKDKSYSKESILFKCECGKEYTTTINSFKSGKQRCDSCSRRLSKYEFKTIKYLDELNIEYKRQKRFKDCRNILPLPFDFYIKELNLLIEIDGEGHYEICYFNNCSKEDAEKSFELTKINDGIKNEYCKNNNIKLLRIPYWEFNNDTYKEILFNNIINV